MKNAVFKPFVWRFRVGSSPTTGMKLRNRMVEGKVENSCQPCGFFNVLMPFTICHKMTHFATFEQK